MRLLRHVRLAETGDNFDAIARRVQMTGKQPDFGFLTADHKPGENKQNAPRPRGQGRDHAATWKTTWTNSRRFSTRSAMNAGASSNGTMSVIMCSRITGPSARSKATVSRARRCLFQPKL